MGTYLIAQPCAIMIRGLPRWLDSRDSTLPWVASTRSSPIQGPTSSQTLHSSRYELPSNHYPWAALNVVHS
jgi:hypothetical protein